MNKYASIVYCTLIEMEDHKVTRVKQDVIVLNFAIK